MQQLSRRANSLAHLDSKSQSPFLVLSSYLARASQPPLPPQPKPSAEAPAPYLNQPGREVPERGAPGRPRPPAAAFGRCMAKRSSSSE